MTPRKPGFAERTRASFARQAFMRHVGAELLEVRPGYCEIGVRFSPQLTQQHGYFHGGLIGTLADTACGYAGFSLLAVEDSIVTAEYKLNILAPGTGEELRARGQVLKTGRSLIVARAEVFALQDERETLVAASQQTLARLANTSDEPPAA